MRWLMDGERGVGPSVRANSAAPARYERPKSEAETAR